MYAKSIVRKESWKKSKSLNNTDWFFEQDPYHTKNKKRQTYVQKNQTQTQKNTNTLLFWSTNTPLHFDRTHPLHLLFDNSNVGSEIRLHRQYGALGIGSGIYLRKSPSRLFQNKHQKYHQIELQGIWFPRKKITQKKIRLACISLVSLFNWDPIKGWT